MIRRPPRSTLFPYTRSSDLARAARRARDDLGSGPHAARLDRALRRSEEHTSELQSLAYLVCRLLLEKKKKKITDEIQDLHLVIRQIDLTSSTSRHIASTHTT